MAALRPAAVPILAAARPVAAYPALARLVAALNPCLAVRLAAGPYHQAVVRKDGASLVWVHAIRGVCFYYYVATVASYRARMLLVALRLWLICFARYPLVAAARPSYG